MNTQTKSFRSTFEILLPWFVLAILLFFTYAKFFGHSYGFRWSASTGQILHVFVDQPKPTLQVGDRLIQVGSVRWDDFASDLQKTFFEGSEHGDSVPIVVERDGQQLTINWKYMGYNRNEFLDQLYSEWWMVYFFWLAGTFTILLVRPKDERWLLMTLFNYLTAIWLSAGSGVSAYHVWNSALVLRVVIILCMPVYLHLHWVFPQTLGKLPPGLVRSAYSITFILAIVQWFQLVPSTFYLLIFMATLGGSVILLVLHIILQPVARRDFRLVFIVLLLAVIPVALWQVIYFFNDISRNIGSIGLLSLPFLPIAYFYAAFRRRLGNWELRFNHNLPIYLFIILVGVILVPLMVLAEYQLNMPQDTLLISLFSTILTAAAFIWLYPFFQRFVTYRILGIPFSSPQEQAAYSTYIAKSASLSDLARVLGGNIFPGFLIRQVAFLHYDGELFKTLAVINVTDDQLPIRKDIRSLISQAGKYLSPDIPGNYQSFSWIRLILPLRAGDELVGFWLLGRRDPDDIYSQAEIPVLQALADQTAIAMSNILQTERIRTLYAGYINRHEEERRQLARELHDGVLNQMAAWLMNRGSSAVQTDHKVQDELVLIRHLREIVTNLRPPMLSYGLKLAIEELADTLMERNNNKVNIIVEIDGGEKSYGTDVEQHIYRIIQEACENALRHGRSTRIAISGRFENNSVDLFIEDNGIGFDTHEELGLDNLILEKHFGLAGMLERAMMINAQLKIKSLPGKGAQIHIKWKSSVN